jgi:rod shape-determining protein MreD
VKRTFRLLAVGCAALVVQGGLAGFVPPRLLPDLPLLVIAAVGLCAPPAIGLTVAAGVGYATDLLSNSLLGEHALLFAVVFAVTRRANRRLNLRGGLPRGVFAFFLTLAYGLALSIVGWSFGTPGLGLALVPGLLLHAVVNALAIPVTSAAVIRVAGGVSDEESGRRNLRLDARRPGALRSEPLR